MVIFQFNMLRYTVNEGGPPVPICVDLVDSLVGPTGETLNVASVGGTAMGKTFADMVLLSVKKLGILLPPNPITSS